MTDKLNKKNKFVVPLLSGLIAICFIMVGIYYFFSNLGVFEKTSVPIIRAPEKPIKVKPEISGGKNIDYTDCKVCQLWDPKNENSETVEILTPPSTPELPAIALPENDNVTSNDNKSNDIVLTQDNNSLEDDNFSSSIIEKNNVTQIELENLPKKENDNDSSTSKTNDLMNQKISIPISKPVSGYYIQLAAFNTKIRAETAVKILNEKLAVSLDGTILKIMQVDLGADKGFWWRIISNKLTREEAESTCALLKSQGQGCIVRSE